MTAKNPTSGPVWTRASIAGAAALVLLAIAMLSSAPARAQDGALVVMIVDVQRVLRDSAAAKSVIGQVETQRTNYEQQLEQRKQALKVEEDELRRQQAILSGEAMDQRRRKLERDYADLRRDAEQRRNLLNTAFNSGMRQVREAMARAVAEVMQEKGATLTLPRSAVLVFNDKLNVTESVVARLNEAMPEVTVNFDAPAAN